MNKYIKYLTSIVGITIFFAVLQYIFAIPLNPFIGESTPFFLLYFVAIGVAIFIINVGKDVSLFLNASGAHVALEKKKYILPLACLVIPFAIIIISNILATPLFTWNSLKNQIGKIEEREFNKDFAKQDVSKLPVVDENLALRLAEKKLGERPDLVSQVKVTTPTIQLYNEELVWVVPLEHSGLFKWLSNMSGTPGYIVVSATNQKDVRFVGDHKIKYQKEAFFNQDLKRKAQYNSLLEGLVDYSFELDEKGVPHWVITKYSNKFLFNIPEATGAVIVNAVNGETKNYNIDKLPEWVDRVQPEQFIMQQINNNGKYIKGIFNFSQSNMYKTSEGQSIVYNNGKCYLFTGITSLASDEGAIGFYLTDMKSKKTVKYMMAGATERAAAMSAEGKVQNLGYQASFPVITNVDSQPTYFTTLRDKEGLIKQYAFINVRDYTTVGNGETKEEALNSYRKNMRNSNIDDEKIDKNDLKVLEGTVKRITSETLNNNTIFKIILEEMPNKIFEIPGKSNEYLSLTEDMDKVKIEYIESETLVNKVETFINITLKGV